ncbi:MAG: YggS family pyridoxal phosphate-dependent enzyme [Gammaproteobacteria bacterium]|nr:YggS family pyridoxal phosphate-dependent enzyme [Gammaproteobacteria bacterium]MCW8840561.1 YggS family pyridoxal phosphate-dependent enzyme [Gammaproteobacteria bacterium]MCW8927973.1 YggS family pyridoxal phosphate-dependent enzyme [Gammaproteobacteria bacterium]MCW8959117.1 YggS family pyridoxal phosphate-dependent enzyme [Gammaproteobacteria bacterium]MCW8973315.1 YggS family pyridoxal phosphate-dependent enzyme [Gammaproteobacteria bacterium]
MTDNLSFSNRLQTVRQRIQRACEAYGRDPSQVTLLAVSKTRQSEELRSMAAEGVRRFGENYLQEALQKIELLADLGLEWHFIGPIQSNKTRTLAEQFDWVHSVDRLKLARRLSEQRPRHLEPLNLCLQVNISGEQSKSGVSLTALPSLAHQVAALPNLRLRGLMAIPAPAENFEQQRIPFRLMRQALEQLQTEGLQLDTLSMGMSSDLEAAIAEGATLVRVGTALFGPRPPRTV